MVTFAASKVHAITLHPGDILVADDGSNAILRVDPMTGEQTIVASFLDPAFIAIDATGDDSFDGIRSSSQT